MNLQRDHNGPEPWIVVAMSVKDEAGNEISHLEVADD